MAEINLSLNSSGIPDTLNIHDSGVIIIKVYFNKEGNRHSEFRDYELIIGKDGLVCIQELEIVEAT